MSLEQSLEAVLQCSKKTKARRAVGVDCAAVTELACFLCSIFNESTEPQPIFDLSHEFLLKLSCKRSVARGIQEFGIVFNCRSPSSTLEEALASAHSAALRLYDKKTEGNPFASDFRDSLRTDIMQHGCGIRVREGALVANTTRSKFMSMWAAVGASEQGVEEPATKMEHTIQRLRTLAKLLVETYPLCEQEQNEEMLKAYVAHGQKACAFSHTQLIFFFCRDCQLSYAIRRAGASRILAAGRTRAVQVPTSGAPSFDRPGSAGARRTRNHRHGIGRRGHRVSAAQVHHLRG